MNLTLGDYVGIGWGLVIIKVLGGDLGGILVIIIRGKIKILKKKDMV